LNFPIGNVIQKGDSPFDFSGVALKLNEKKFNGYVILTVKGNYIEEGAIFFREGEIVACTVECLVVGKNLKGNESLEFFYNQTRGLGYYHCVELTRSQVDLVTAFDEKLLVSKIDLKGLPKTIPFAFSSKFEASEKQNDVLETYGLGELK
jgi:hypothetical protein